MSAREWKPGDVAVATVRGVPDVRVFRWVDVYGHLRWDSARLVDGECTHLDEQVTTARPLVVIDPEDREQVERLWRGLPDSWALDMDDESRTEAFEGVQAALRKFANPTPPKPEEPTGLGAVVEDDAGTLWVRATSLSWAHSDGCGEWRRYADIDAVRVLSEGVTA